MHTYREETEGVRWRHSFRNRRFMNYDPKFRVDSEAAMATVEVVISSDSSMPLRQLSRKAGSAFKKTNSSVSSILKGSLALLTRGPGPAARTPRRKTVSWAQAVTQ